MELLDFEIEIDEGAGANYPVAVLRSPAGEARATMRFPYDDLALENKLMALQLALLGGSGRGRRRIIPPHEKDVRDFGASLYEALFTGEVGRLLDLSRDEARNSGKGLRIKLRCRVPHLAALPWEFLFDERADEYLCLSRNTPVVRYLEVAARNEPIKVEPPLRILAMVSSPQGLPELDVAREKQRIDDALAELTRNGLVVVEWLQKATWRELQRALNRETWHAFHFVGHGGFDDASGEGVLALEHDDGSLHRLGADDLSALLGDYHALNLVVLNSCEGARASASDVFSSSAAALVKRGAPAVVAMQYEITDLAAIEIAQTFYDCIAHGSPVDTALAEARKAVRLGLPGTLEWGTPVLFMRSPDGVLFDVAKMPATPRIEDAAPKEASLLQQLGPFDKRRAAALVAVIAMIAGVIAFVARDDGGAPPAAGPMGLNSPKGIGMTGDGTLLIADALGGRVMSYKDGKTALLAGSDNGIVAESGTASRLKLDYPAAVVAARNGTIVIAEHGMNLLRRLRNGQLTSIRPEPLGSADVRATGLAVVPATTDRFEQGTLLVATSYTVYAIDTKSRMRAIAGTGRPGFKEGPQQAEAARLDSVEGVAVTDDGTIYIADARNQRVRKIASDGTISTVAGNGGSQYLEDGQLATEGALNYPVDVALDGDGILHILDGKTVFRLNPDGTAAVVAKFSETDGFGGDGGPAEEAKVQGAPEGLAIEHGESADIFILDTGNNRVRKIDRRGIVMTIA